MAPETLREIRSCISSCMSTFIIRPEIIIAAEIHLPSMLIPPLPLLQVSQTLFLLWFQTRIYICQLQQHISIYAQKEEQHCENNTSVLVHTSMPTRPPVHLEHQAIPNKT